MRSNHQWIRQAVQQYERPLVRYATRLLGDGARGQDVVQETFLRLCRHGTEVAPPKLQAWLYTVCRNHALDMRRKEMRMNRISSEQLEDTASGASPPSAPLEAQESRSQILRQLAQLPANQQETIRLKFQDNLSYKQIAQITGLTPGHVGYLIHMGLKDLRHRLDQNTV